MVLRWTDHSGMIHEEVYSDPIAFYARARFLRERGYGVEEYAS
jgi:hypothetical protein